MEPFRKLKAPRYIPRHEMPSVLADFYELHEGIGCDSAPTVSIRLCRLDELQLRGSLDIRFLKYEDPASDWGQFEGWLVGVGQFFDEIYLVEQAPSCAQGTILALGIDVAGPGGTGPSVLEPSLVLAESFPAWIDHLAACSWTEYGLVPGAIGELSQNRQAALRGYYAALNPGISWGPTTA